MFTGLIRSVILYAVLVVGIRLMGKRQVGELEPSELVLSLVIADLAAVPMQDYGIPLLSGVLPILTLLCLTMILSVLTMKSLRLRTLVCGRPSVVIRDGMPDQAEMARNRLTVDELLEELRGQGITEFSAVKYAVLETNGRLSVLPFAAQRPPTCQELGLSPEDARFPVVVISDGRVLEENLAFLGFSRTWLDKELTKQGFKDPRRVFLLCADRTGHSSLVPKEDDRRPIRR